MVTEGRRRKREFCKRAGVHLEVLHLVQRRDVVVAQIQLLDLLAFYIIKQDVYQQLSVRISGEKINPGLLTTREVLQRGD